jgi:hypothetical protein
VAGARAHPRRGGLHGPRRGQGPHRAPLPHRRHREGVPPGLQFEKRSSRPSWARRSTAPITSPAAAAPASTRPRRRRSASPDASSRSGASESR